MYISLVNVVVVHDVVSHHDLGNILGATKHDQVDKGVFVLFNNWLKHFGYDRLKDKTVETRICALLMKIIEYRALQNFMRS